MPGPTRRCGRQAVAKPSLPDCSARLPQYSQGASSPRCVDQSRRGDDRIIDQLAAACPSQSDLLETALAATLDMKAAEADAAETERLQVEHERFQSYIQVPSDVQRTEMERRSFGFGRSNGGSLRTKHVSSATDELWRFFQSPCLVGKSHRMFLQHPQQTRFGAQRPAQVKGLQLSL